MIKDVNRVLCELLDLIFSFCYELRVMDGEFTCESGFTINKLSSVLSCFVSDLTPQDTILHSFKRGLSYPLIR